MEAVYKNKFERITASQLESDAVAETEAQNIYLNGGTYLIKDNMTGRLYPIDEKLFEYLFEKEETNE